MPMTSTKAGTNIREFHTGSRYREMMKKYGKKKADQVAVAAGLSASRRAKAKRS